VYKCNSKYCSDKTLERDNYYGGNGTYFVDCTEKGKKIRSEFYIVGSPLHDNNMYRRIDDESFPDGVSCFEGGGQAGLGGRVYEGLI